MNDSDLVTVIGAGPGLGRAVAAAFADRGDHVVLLARDARRLADIAASVRSGAGGEVGTVSADASDEVSLRAAFTEIRDRYGEPTVLVHNPSIAVEAPPTRTTQAALIDGVRLAAGSLLVAAQEVAPAMRRAGRGTILVTGGGSALTGSTWSAALAVQKAAVRNLAFSLAAELAPDGIHVVTVTIDGVLGDAGLEPDRIAAEYVRQHEATDGPRSAWRPEVTWGPAGPSG
ncbi:MAG TPA: SDR family NAD(P)-dependent oxidoreductase [Jiangellaceae bacterium]|nr:SDR family NAD(P)-dependent oxidoreductase [Jiangellaceae bacterium]